MIFRNLDENHDWTWGSGKANYVSGNAAIGLNIETRILSWVGDCFFDMGCGIDWTNLLGSLGQENMLNLNLRRLILQSYGVTGINSFFVTLNAQRLFKAEYDISTVYSASYKNQITQDIQNAG